MNRNGITFTLTRFAAALAIACLSPFSASAFEPADWSPAWAMDSVWNDGQAEVSHYGTTREVYGKTREFETVAIVVREDMNRAFHAKADPPYEAKDLISVLKLNLVQNFPTENYDYHYMASVFVEQAAPWSLAKQAMTSQEWCGTTFKLFAPYENPPTLHFHSYWDGQGDGSHPLEFEPGDLTEEQWIVSLRSLDFSKAPFETAIRALPNQISSKAQKPTWRDATLKVTAAEKIEVPAGAFEAHKVEVAGVADAAPALYFQTDAPHTLLKADYGDGRRLVLRKTSRRVYW